MGNSRHDPASGTPSGSRIAPLTAEALRRYAASELSSSDAHAIEARLLGSELHQDAAAGLSAAGPAAEAATADLMARLEARVNASQSVAEPAFQEEEILMTTEEPAEAWGAAPQLAVVNRKRKRWLILGGVFLGFAALGGGLLFRYDRYVDEETAAAKTRRAANYKGEDLEPKGFFESLFSADDGPTPEEIAQKRVTDSVQFALRVAQVERLRVLEEQPVAERDAARRARDAAATAAAIAAAPAPRVERERNAEPATRRMRGQITTDAGIAIGNATVTIRATGRKVAVGPDGSFSLDMPTGIDPTLDVDAPGFVTRTTRANGDGQLNLRLSTAEAVAVQGMASAVAAEKRIRSVRPEPEGGYAGYFRYLASAAALPDPAKRAKVNGQVQVEIKVNPNGTVSDFRVVQGLGYGCDEEAVRVIQDGPKWTPGKVNGEPVIKTVSMPVTFGK